MKKFLGSLFFILVALVIFIIAAKDVILKTVMEQGVTRLTGFATKVDSLKYHFPSTIHITGLNIQNPEQFEAKTFVNIPEIYISVVLDEILKGKQIHLPEVRLNIQEVNIEKNRQGVSNVELLSSVGGKSGQKAPAKTEPAEKKPAMPFWLEKLDLTIRKVGYVDHSGIVGKVPVGNKVAMDLNVQNQVFTDIRDPKVLVNLILVKILNGATLGRLLEIDPQQLLGGTLGGAQDLLNQGVGVAGKTVGQATDLVTNNAAALTDNAVAQKTGALLKGSAGEAQQALGSTATAAKSTLTGLLGKVKSAAASPSPAAAQ